MHSPFTLPVSHSAPLGRSIATFFAFDAFTAAKSSAVTLSGSPLKPNPKTLSIITSALLIAFSDSSFSVCRSMTVMPFILSNIVIASSATGLPQASTTLTSYPFAFRYSAATKPSPPFLPLPQITVTFSFSVRKAFSVSTAQAIPARFIISRYA